MEDPSPEPGPPPARSRLLPLALVCLALAAALGVCLIPVGLAYKGHSERVASAVAAARAHAASAERGELEATYAACHPRLRKESSAAELTEFVTAAEVLYHPEVVLDVSGGEEPWGDGERLMRLWGSASSRGRRVEVELTLLGDGERWAVAGIKYGDRAVGYNPVLGS